LAPNHFGFIYLMTLTTIFPWLLATPLSVVLMKL
jgi:hypothetical protein